MLTNQCILENIRDLQTDFFLPTGIHTNGWVFRSQLYHIWFQKDFQTHTLLWQAKPALSASLAVLLPPALHFWWGFQMLWHNTAGVSTLLTILSLFSVFSTIWEQFSIDYRCCRYEQRQKKNAEFFCPHKPQLPVYIQHNLYWLNRCLLSKGIPRQSKVSHSSVCWTSEYWGFAIYLQVITVMLQTTGEYPLTSTTQHNDDKIVEATSRAAALGLLFLWTADN